MKQQYDARLTEVYVRMTPQEISAFDLRKERISQIHVILASTMPNGRPAPIKLDS